jgi:hypothetical protein
LTPECQSVGDGVGAGVSGGSLPAGLSVRQAESSSAAARTKGRTKLPITVFIERT